VSGGGLDRLRRNRGYQSVCEIGEGNIFEATNVYCAAGGRGAYLRFIRWVENHSGRSVMDGSLSAKICVFEQQAVEGAPALRSQDTSSFA